MPRKLRGARTSKQELHHRSRAIIPVPVHSQAMR